MAVRQRTIRLRRTLWLVALFLLLPSLALSQPSVVGQWSGVVDWPQAPVHMTLQTDGTVVMWPASCGCIPNAELGGGQHVRVWNPSSNQFTLNRCDSNVFCSGHAPLADGRTLVVGGHVTYWVGLRDANIFNADRTWTRVGDMAQPRWYPSAVRLADGRVLAISGNSTSRTAFADIPEVFDPMTNAWTSLTNASQRLPAYSFLFVIPGGNVLVAGPDRITRRLNVATQSWTTIGDSFITAHSAVQYLPGRIMKSGTFGNIDDGVPGVDARTVVLDTTVANPQWRETAPMAFRRAFHTLTLLPDGTVLATGGDTTANGQNEANAVLAAELWNPATETWRTLASNQVARLYHSTALLLPDGRVVSAGGEYAPYLEENAEFFSPPYLFNGPRPTITSAPTPPTTIGYNTAFTVQTPNSDIAKVSIIATASVTHGFNMNQRYLSLPFTPIAGGVSVQAPSAPDLAPPGYYLLFLLNTAGVPSVGRFVQILGGTPSSTTTTLIPPPSTTTSSTTPTPSTTSTTAAPVPTTTSTTATTPTTTSSTTSTLPPAAGLVAAYGFDENGGSGAPDASGTGNNGTLSGPTWLAPGRFGASALVFNGTTAYVGVPDSNSLDLSELTLEAWIYPTDAAMGGNYRMIFAKTTTGTPVNYYFAINNGILNFGFFNGGWREHRSAVGPTLNAWNHVAAVYSDSANQVRLYLGGSQVYTGTEATSLLTNTEQLRIGIGFPDEAFAGRIDEVRVYNRALTTQEIANDVNRPVGGGGGTTSTSTTSSTTSTSTSTSRTTTSSTSTSTTSTTSSSTSSSSAPVPSTTSTSRTTTTTSSTSTTTSSTSSSSTSTSTSSSSTSPPPPSTSTTATPTSSTSTSTAAVPAGLVAAYGFEETTGAVLDSSGSGFTGTISGATRSTTGQFGRSISFDGVNDWISVPDAAALDLTTGLTLEAWVNPTNVGYYRTIIAKTTNGLPVNYYLSISNGTLTFGFFNGAWREHRASVGPALNAWSHVAATFNDAANQVVLYLNGTAVLTSAETTSLTTNADQLRIGVGFPDEAFAGRIDEVRVYNRALSAAEVAADRLRAVP